MSIIFDLERTNQLSLLPDKDLVDLCLPIEPYQVTKSHKLYQLDVSVIFLLISLAAVKKFGVATENSHLDSTSLSVEGEYKKEYPTVEILKSGAVGEEIEIRQQLTSFLLAPNSENFAINIFT